MRCIDSMVYKTKNHRRKCIANPIPMSTCIAHIIKYEVSRIIMASLSNPVESHHNCDEEYSFRYKVFIQLFLYSISYNKGTNDTACVQKPTKLVASTPNDQT